VLALTLGAASCEPRSEPLTDELRDALASIRPDAIERDMHALAADSLAGRETGSPGFLLAAEYVANRFAELGLRPAGGDGTFFQFVEFRRAVLAEEECSLQIRRGNEIRTLRPFVDYYFSPDMLREAVDVSAPLVFAGFGVTAPELGHDDYAGLDVRGKVLVLFSGAPPAFPHNERAYYSKGLVKRTNARDRGALGMLWMATPEREESRPFSIRVRNARQADMGWIDEAGRVVDVYPELRVSASLSPEGMEIVFAGSEKPLQQILVDVGEGAPGAFDLPSSISARTASRQSTARSPNIAAILPGSDPRLADEYVVLSAHLDHLGVGEPVEGDSIFNGAFDNASGSAILMELARALAELEAGPARSILFLAVTGEEKGLLGSDYFARHPAVPLEAIVANVNLDMVLMLHPLRDVIAFGAEHSSLERPLARAARHLSIAVTPDPIPQEVIFVRSDQYSFVHQGVPALYVIPGEQSGDPQVDGAALNKEWRKLVYHSPQDGMDQRMDFGAGADFARLNFLLTCFVADAPERPRWNEGDFFGDLFAGPASGARGEPADTPRSHP
jgi:hypothetical protein